MDLHTFTFVYVLLLPPPSVFISFIFVVSYQNAIFLQFVLLIYV